MSKIIISCAITGSIHTPSMSPHLPVTGEQIAARPPLHFQRLDMAERPSQHDVGRQVKGSVTSNRLRTTRSIAQQLYSVETFL